MSFDDRKSSPILLIQHPLSLIRRLTHHTVEPKDVRSAVRSFVSGRLILAQSAAWADGWRDQWLVVVVELEDGGRPRMSIKMIN